MANQEHIEMLKQGAERWNEWRKINKGIKPDLAGADLKEADLSQINLADSNLSEANLSWANLVKTDLRTAKLINTDLNSANLSGANLSGALMTNGNLDMVTLDGSTKLGRLRFTIEHRSLEDGTDNLYIPWKLKVLQWSFIRNIGQLPLFGISWIGLTTSLLILNNLGWWNSSFARKILLLASVRGPIPEHLTFEIPIPSRLILTVLDALLLVIGSTLYKFACPQRIQTFTEVEWVEQHRHPRLLYLSESFSRPVLRVVTLFFLLLGGLLTLYLLVASIVSATQYAWPVMVQWFVL